MVAACSYCRGVTRDRRLPGVAGLAYGRRRQLLPPRLSAADAHNRVVRGAVSRGRRARHVESAPPPGAHARKPMTPRTVPILAATSPITGKNFRFDRK